MCCEILGSFISVKAVATMCCAFGALIIWLLYLSMVGLTMWLNTLSEVLRGTTPGLRPHGGEACHGEEPPQSLAVSASTCLSHTLLSGVHCWEVTRDGVHPPREKWVLKVRAGLVQHRPDGLASHSARPTMKQETFSCGALSLSLLKPDSRKNWNLRKVQKDQTHVRNEHVSVSSPWGDLCTCGEKPSICLVDSG